MNVCVNGLTDCYQYECYAMSFWTQRA